MKKSAMFFCNLTFTVIALISILANGANRNIRLYIDGVFTAEANFTLTIVKDQRQVQAVHVENSVPSSDALFLASSSNGIRTDESWRCTNVYHDGWFLPHYDDSLWPEAFVVDNNTHAAYIAPDAKWIGYVQISNKIYCRRNTTIGKE